MYNFTDYSANDKAKLVPIPIDKDDNCHAMD